MMREIFFSFWWLLFPLGAFAFAAWDRWLSYKRSRDALDAMKGFVAQGKEPPPELVRAAHADPIDDRRADRDEYRYRRRAWRRGPFWELRRAIFLGALAAGLAYAGQYWAEDRHTAEGFMIAAVVLGVIAVGSLLMALVPAGRGDK